MGERIQNNADIRLLFPYECHISNVALISIRITRATVE